MAEAYYIPFAPHNPSGPVANAATFYNWRQVVRNFSILEIMYSDVDYRKDITNEQLDYADGYMAIPDRTGAGIEIDEATCPHIPISRTRCATIPAR